MLSEPVEKLKDRFERGTVDAIKDVCNTTVVFAITEAIQTVEYEVSKGKEATYVVLNFERDDEDVSGSGARGVILLQLRWVFSLPN